MLGNYVYFLLKSMQIVMFIDKVFNVWKVCHADLLKATDMCPSQMLRHRDKQGWISDMGIDGPTFVPKSGYFLPILVKVCPQKLAFS